MEPIGVKHKLPSSVGNKTLKDQYTNAVKLLKEDIARIDAECKRRENLDYEETVEFSSQDDRLVFQRSNHDHDSMLATVDHELEEDDEAR